MNQSVKTAIDWPPAYQLIKSNRAKRPSIRISVQHGLQVVVPKRFNLKYIDRLLSQNQQWILNQLAKHPANIGVSTLPEYVALIGINEHWLINYQNVDDIKKLTTGLSQVTIQCELNDQQQAMALLRPWLLKKAKRHFTIMLDQLSTELGLPYKKLSVRGQKTRWGSCSSAKNINLNFKLLFVAEDIIRYVMVHELCHTQFMDHSAQFWQLVAEHDINYIEHRRVLSVYAKKIPCWLACL